jgi:hypothetical protein
LSFTCKLSKFWKRTRCSGVLRTLDLRGFCPDITCEIQKRTAKLDATTQRWIAALSSYNFEIKYRPGVNNADVDALSRLPALANITDNTSELPLASVQAICNFISVPAIETISFSAEMTNHLSDPFISNRVDLADAQNKDGVLRFWISQVMSGQKPRRYQQVHITL